MTTVADVVITLASAIRPMVGGRPIACPTIWSRWVRAKRVKSGMLSASVPQKPTIAVKAGQKLGQNCPALAPPGAKAEGAVKIGPTPPARSSAHQTSAAHTAILIGAVQVSSRRTIVSPFCRNRIWTSQKAAKAISCPAPISSVGNGVPARLRPAITPSRVSSASPPIQVWMPYQPQATSARASAGSRAPLVPKAARASTA